MQWECNTRRTYCVSILLTKVIVERSKRRKILEKSNKKGPDGYTMSRPDRRHQPREHKRGYFGRGIIVYGVPDRACLLKGHHRPHRGTIRLPCSSQTLFLKGFRPNGEIVPRSGARNRALRLVTVWTPGRQDAKGKKGSGSITPPPLDPCACARACVRA